MKRKFFTLLLALVMVLGLAASASAAADRITSGDWTYELHSGKATLVSYDGTATEVVVPAKIDGYAVDTLGWGMGSAFSDVADTMTSVTLEEGIATVNNAVFENCTALKSAYIPGSVTSIGMSAFEGCTSLTDVTLNDGLKQIGHYAFLNTGLTSIYLPASVNLIYDYALGYTGEWGDVEKNENFAIFGWSGTGAQKHASDWHFTFYRLEDMEETSGRCGDNAAWRFEDSTATLYIEGEDDTDPYYNHIAPWIAYSAQIKRVVIGEGISRLGDCTFADHYPNLTEVVLSESVMSLGNAAFLNCTALTEIEISPRLAYFGGRTFQNTGLKEVVFPDDMDYAANIGGECFADCAELTYVKLPAEVDWTGNGLFKNCTKLSEVDMSGCTYIGTLGDEMFRNCDSLTSIDFHTATSIEGGMYQDCDGLREIVIPACVTYLHTDAFADCDNLTNVVFTGDIPNYNADVFRNDTLTAWYPAGNATWTENHLHGHGGTITWKSYEPLPFTDVIPGSFYFDPVAWAVENSITTGVSETLFDPNGLCQRGQIVTFLWRAAGCPDAAGENPFTDVTEADYYYDAVLWAVENGITTGTSETTFSPFKTCTRAEVVTFLWRAAGKPAAQTENPFVDVTESDFFCGAVLWAVENGITNGMDATHFGPLTICNRAQVVTFLYRASKVPAQEPETTYTFTLLSSDPTEETGLVMTEGTTYAAGESVLFYAEPWYGYLVEFTAEPAGENLELYYLGAHTYELIMPAHDVTLTANFVPAEGSARYITTACTNGYAFADCDMDEDLNDFAKPGEHVLFYIIPDEGFTFSPEGFTATANGESVAECWYLGELVEEDPDLGTIDGIFLVEMVMPDADVSVSITCTAEAAADAAEVRIPVTVQ